MYEKFNTYLLRLLTTGIFLKHLHILNVFFFGK